MVNKNSNNFDNEIVDLVLEEYNPNVRKAEAFKNKLAEVKSKIISNINKNINHYRGIEICPTSMLVLKDGATHKIITLRCGAHRVYEITTPKKEGMTEIQILNSLLKMIGDGKFDDKIEAYAKGSPMVEKRSKNKKTNKTTSNNKKCNKSKKNNETSTQSVETTNIVQSAE